MSQHSQLQSKLDKTMSSEQFTEVIAAISEGKYSWACVLILRIAGYNPLHYIPYRTYNRLIKENVKRAQFTARSAQDICSSRSREAPPNRLVHLEDLDYVEAIHQSKASVRGGSFQRMIRTLRQISF